MTRRTTPSTWARPTSPSRCICVFSGRCASTRGATKEDSTRFPASSFRADSSRPTRPDLLGTPAQEGQNHFRSATVSFTGWRNRAGYAAPSRASFHLDAGRFWSALRAFHSRCTAASRAAASSHPLATAERSCSMKGSSLSDANASVRTRWRQPEDPR